MPRTTTRTRSAGRTRRAASSRSPLPIPDYDELSVSDIQSRIDDLSAPEIRKLQSYEEKHKGRQTLLRKFEQQRSSAGGRGRAEGARTASRGRSSSRGATATRARGTSQRATAARGRGGARSGRSQERRSQERRTAERRGEGRSRGGGRQGSSRRTTDHETIQRWIEERGGKPVSVRGTERGGDAGVLRVDFPGYGAGREDLAEISWDEFFEKFDEKNLEFLYQDRTSGGKESRFFKFVSRGNTGRGQRAASSRSSRSR